MPRVCLVGGALGAWWLHSISCDVIRVREVGARVTAERLKGLGAPNCTLAPGTSAFSRTTDPTWVLNESNRPVYLERIGYGTNFGIGPPAPTIIPPGTGYLTFDIDYVGPNNPPPRQIEVDGVEAQIGMSSRAWVTWDP